MNAMKKLRLTTPTDHEVAMTWVFDAPRKLVFEVLITPELLKRWLLGPPPDWELAVCDIDLRAGGSYRYVWRRQNGTEMGITTEVFDKSWYTGEAVVTQVLVDQGGCTTLAMTIRFDSTAARDEEMKTPMKTGVAASYERLDQILTERKAAAGAA